MPSLRQLRYFLAIADLQSFTAAAATLHVAQPALTRHLASLEEELGTQLLARTSRSVRLTEAGQRFRAKARRLLEDLEFACREAQAVGSGTLRYVRLAHSSSVPLAGLLGQRLQAWLATHPTMQVEINQTTSENQIDDIAAGRSDLGLVRLPVLRRATGVTIQPILREALWAALPSGHPLARGPSVPLNALAEQSFVFAPHPDRGGLSRAVYEVCQQAGFVPRCAQATSRKQSFLQLIALGLGVGLIPESMALAAPPGVATLPLAEAVWTDVALVYRTAPDDGPPLPDLSPWQAEASLNRVDPASTGP